MRSQHCPADVPDVDVTPRDVFFNRRAFMRAAAAAGLVLGPIGCGESTPRTSDAGGGTDPRIVPPRQWPDGFATPKTTDYAIPEGIDATLTPRMVAATNNNFYEFLPGRAGDLWRQTGRFRIEPWELRIEGECNRPMTLSLSDLDAIEHEERLYHFRCVERWAMNVP
ncbi:MAG: molybdopterin-dependent oxidoreductase, partial [Planctomycetota bacterium]